MAWLSFGIPGLVLALVGLAAWESLPRNKRKRPGTPLSATYVNEVTALFYGSKRVELDHRDSTSILREDDAEGAPPRLGVDLDHGLAILREPEPTQPGKPARRNESEGPVASTQPGKAAEPAGSASPAEPVECSRPADPAGA